MLSQPDVLLTAIRNLAATLQRTPALAYRSVLQDAATTTTPLHGSAARRRPSASPATASRSHPLPMLADQAHTDHVARPSHTLGSTPPFVPARSADDRRVRGAFVLVFTVAAPDREERAAEYAAGVPGLRSSHRGRLVGPPTSAVGPHRCPGGPIPQLALAATGSPRALPSLRLQPLPARGRWRSSHVRPLGVRSRSLRRRWSTCGSPADKRATRCRALKR